MNSGVVHVPGEMGGAERAAAHLMGLKGLGPSQPPGTMESGGGWLNCRLLRGLVHVDRV